MNVRERRPMPLGAVLTAALSALVCVGACTRPPPDATPQGAVRAFLDDIEAAEDDPRAMPRVYDHLGPEARANLEERARRTAALQGRHVEPWEMLASGRFGLPFRANPSTMSESRVGSRATVEVFGADPAHEHASVVCVREGGHWHIEPGLPDP